MISYDQSELQVRQADAVFAQAGQDLIRPPGQFRLRVHGTARALSDAIEDQLLLIAREGLTNADRHARASEVTLELEDGERVRAGRVILAADAWTNDLLRPLGCPLPLTVTVSVDTNVLPGPVSVNVIEPVGL